MFDAANEIELLKGVAAGDETAFRKLYTGYHQLLRVHIYRLTESMESADEIVQDVFLKIWNTREALGGINNFKAYLFVVSKNYAISYLRKHVRQTIQHQKWQSEEVNLFATEEDSSASVDYYGLLDEAIDQLPPQQKTAYILSRHEQLTYAGIATQMEVSRETVKKYLQIAVASITAYVQKQQGNLW